MEKKEQWLSWIEDQIKDMHSEDYEHFANNTNRVFKTDEDDRDIAIYVLETLRDIIKESK